MNVRTLLLLGAACCFLSGCNGSPDNPTAAEQVYGASVNATDAIPAPAVAAESDRYRNRLVTMDGRISARIGEGCTLQLDTENGPPLRIEAARTADGACTWQVPATLDGIAAATGMLRIDGDTLRLSANGVQVTPLRQSGTDSDP